MKKLYKVLYHAVLDGFVRYNCTILLEEEQNIQAIATFLVERDYPKHNGFLNHGTNIVELNKSDFTDVKEWLNQSEPVLEIEEEINLDLDVWGEIFT